ncbi:Beta-glucosidase 44 [Zea mays]|uniref:Beta-glucosidase 44 n=1 Tax=Zea mays TaxID=4577 RepID=A0A1D6FCX8_MAIZE|nr:Beta-glucosidase 44 [Zea mays]
MAHKDGRGPSIWDAFIKIPGEIANNATADVTVDEYHRYKEDVNIMKNMGFDAYRFSISWSRIFPNGTGEVNWKGVAYYNRLINYMVKKGITPYANLYHYDLPEALEVRYGGLLSREVVRSFADYADFCFGAFGDRGGLLPELRRRAEGGDRRRRQLRGILRLVVARQLRVEAGVHVPVRPRLRRLQDAPALPQELGVLVQGCHRRHQLRSRTVASVDLMACLR